MATTYSQTATGYVTGSLLGPQSYDIPDLSSSGIQTGVAGGQAKAMAVGDLMLVKRPDGSQGWYKLDAERSTAANPVLVPVGL